MAKAKKMTIEIEGMEYVTTEDLIKLAIGFIASCGVYCGKTSKENESSTAEALGTALMILAKAGEVTQDGMMAMRAEHEKE